MSKRPLTVTIIGCVYLIMGAVGFAYHANELTAWPIPPDAIWVELLRLSAILFGAYLLRGQNWARWLVLAWMGLHVVIGAFHNLAEFAMHCLFFAILLYCLFRQPAATRYFAR